MKLTRLLAIFLGIFLTIPDVHARGGGRSRGSGGGSHHVSPPKRSSGGGGHSQRNPMSGSKIQHSQPKAPTRHVSQPKKEISRPSTKPATRPATRPSRPESRPQPQRPTIQRPEQKPSTRPGSDNRLPDRRPSADRPDRSRPSTLPGMISYPDKPDKRPNRPGGGDNHFPGGNNRPGDGDHKFPGGNNRPGNNDGPRLPGMDHRPGNDHRGPNIHDNDRFDHKGPSIINRDRFDHNNIGFKGGDRNNVHFGDVNIGRRNMGLNRPAVLPADRRHWDGNRWGGNNGVWGNRINIGNDINIDIDNDFRFNNNFSYRPDYWGARPWWGCGNYYPWHHGHWDYGWNNHYHHSHWWYDDDDFAEGFMWGIGVWSLGNLIYNMGYHSYSNPYPAPRVENTYITYSEPVSVAAAANPPGDEQAAASAETATNDALDASRAAFSTGDYVTALTKADDAIRANPGDVTLHEYRALCYFALGKFSEAAGVLNTVLASGPGWGWDTMSAFYGDSDAYQTQLRKLEDYVKQTGKADGHFLLGYHYLVAGNMEESRDQFAKAAELQPKDSISRQLAALTADSVPSEDSDDPPAERPDPVPVEKLVGAWTSDTGDGKITFTMTEGGDYTWSFKPSKGDATELKGTYGLNDKGLLVLSSDDTQMVSAVEMKDGGKMQFTLIGAPDSDPGLEFTKG